MDLTNFDWTVDHGDKPSKSIPAGNHEPNQTNKIASFFDFHSVFTLRKKCPRSQLPANDLAVIMGLSSDDEEEEGETSLIVPGVFLERIAANTYYYTPRRE